MASSRNVSGSQDSIHHDSFAASNRSLRGPASFSPVPQSRHPGIHLPEPENIGLDDKGVNIIKILDYLKSAFDDENTLDALPLEAAGNPGAWNAWQAYRKSNLQEPEMNQENPLQLQSRSHFVKVNVVSHKKQLDGWSWDGVWEERVQKGINASISDSVLYGNVGGSDDLVCCIFLCGSYY